MALQLCHRVKSHIQKFQKINTFFLLILLSLFSFYFITSNTKSFIWFFSFFGVIVISITLAQQHPSQQQSHIYATKDSSNRVIWSIGCDQKLEQVENSGFLVKGFENGDIYEGEIFKGKCVGKGVYNYYMCGNGKYEGDWVNGKYEGYGVEMWLKGGKYKGQYRNGLRHGFGVYMFYNGDVYEGEWFNGFCHGVGVHVSYDGSTYVGLFKWGVKHGFGHFHYRNGDVYAGEYFTDKMHGFGVYKFGNGHQYEGSWHEGKHQGFGLYTFKNGEAQFGYWQNGILHNASNSRPCPAQVSDVVRKAREAAQRSYSLTVADDRVREAVKAANRAANAARVAAVKAVQQRFIEGVDSGNIIFDVC